MFSPMPFVGGGSFPIDAADFDGTTYMKTGAALTGQANSKLGTISFWYRYDVQVPNARFMAGATTVGGATLRALVFWGASNLITIQMRNSAAATILDLRSTTTVNPGAAWHHLAASWDLGTATTDLYVDDVSDKNVLTVTNDTIDYNGVSDWSIGASPAGASILSCCLAGFYFKMGQRLDLSVTANRRKLRTAGGKPANLGTTGVNPGLGTPEIYQNIGDGESAANFVTNRGGAGNFTVTAGALATCSTSPSD